MTAGVQLIQQQDAAKAFEQGKVQNLRVIGSVDGWHYTFQLRDPTTGSIQTYRTKTARGHPKSWSSPSTLFRHLLDCFGVQRGSWQLQKG